MARDGSGVYSLPANTLAVSGDPISSTKFNTLVQDLESDANTDRPVTAGGTGASTAAAARTNLGITGNLYDVTASAFALTILDDADAGAVRTTIGAAAASHSHPISDITNLQTTLDAKANLSGATFTGAINGPSLSISSTEPALVLSETDTSTLGRMIVTGGDMYLQSGAAGAGSSGSGDLYFSGYNSADIGTFQVRHSGAWRNIWHAGNDGAGSGLDADTLDGIQGSAFAQLSGAAFTGVISVTNASQTPISISRTGSSGGVGIQYVNTEGSFGIFGAPTGSGTGVLFPSTDNQIDLGTTVNSWRNGVFDGIVFANTIELGNASDTTLSRASAGQIAVEGVQVVTVSNAVTLTNKTLTAPVISTISNTGTLTLPTSTDTLVGRATTDTLTNKTLTSPTINGGALSGTLLGTPTFSGGVTLTTPTINGGTIQSRPQAASETTGTLTVASANKTIQATGDITINNSVFAAGDIILIYAGASARTLTQGSGVTMRLGGSATTGSRTLAARGVAMLFFVSASEVVVSGSGVT